MCITYFIAVDIDEWDHVGEGALLRQLPTKDELLRRSAALLIQQVGNSWPSRPCGESCPLCGGCGGGGGGGSWPAIFFL